MVMEQNLFYHPLFLKPHIFITLREYLLLVIYFDRTTGYQDHSLYIDNSIVHFFLMNGQNVNKNYYRVYYCIV